jgi:hypothetical protein
MIFASLENNKGDENWDGGLSDICDDFQFLNHYFDLQSLHEWCARRAESPRTDVGDNSLQPTLFFHALCRALQNGENHLTPLDALWLGLIDTVHAGAPPARFG